MMISTPETQKQHAHSATSDSQSSGVQTEQGYTKSDTRFNKFQSNTRPRMVNRVN